MSPRDWKFRIQDILQAICDIESFIQGVSEDQFKNDKKLQYAVMRALEIIGEASASIPEDIKNQFNEIPWRLMKDMRNKLAHEYFGADISIIWSTIHNNLIPLKNEFQDLVKKSKK
jgi:uncharacterized protein with HEPN domain